ncbi:MAG TPA: HD domain-containing phosphohydrolase [bacterium]|jgi:HD-GYP domain-containing protein (c-di-GMP phosphodiesterase class II)
MTDGNGKHDGEWSPSQLGEPYELFADIVKALSLVMDLVEQATHEHAQRVAAIAFNLGKLLELPESELRDIYYAGLLHDIGQIGTPDSILRKKGALTLRDKSAIYAHPYTGYEIVHEIPTLDDSASLIRWHHERWDGTGYPDALRWEGIPTGASILSIADSLDAFMSPRPWRDALPPDVAMNELRKFSGIQYHPGFVGVTLDFVKKNSVEDLWTVNDSTRDVLKKETEKHRSFTRITGGRILGIVDLFSRIIDARHKYSRGHSRRVANLAKEIGKQLGFEQQELFKLEISGLLHEAGKVGVSSAIVDKAGKLTDSEREIMREYPLVSERIVSSISSIEELGPVVRHQHERFDGTGYPDGLRGDKIPIFSRIIAVADTYDAMASHRAYRKALPLEHILREMQKDFGSGRFDPDLAGIEDILRRDEGGPR